MYDARWRQADGTPTSHSPLHGGPTTDVCPVPVVLTHVGCGPDLSSADELFEVAVVSELSSNRVGYTTKA